MLASTSHLEFKEFELFLDGAEFFTDKTLMHLLVTVENKNKTSRTTVLQNISHFYLP